MARLMVFPPNYTILLLVCWSFKSFRSCASDNHLVPGKPLSINNTLISQDGTFALGFFFPSNSSTRKRYYLGIWYNTIPQRTYVWVANRANPITDPSSAALSLTNSSNLIVSNADGHVLWTTNIRSSNSPATNAVATLDNTGNFILRSSSDGTQLWQSFDYPTDTLLPGMNFRISNKTHTLGQLISWKEPEDPYPSNFSFSPDPKSYLHRFIWNGTRPYWQSPVLKSHIFVGGYLPGNLQRIGDEIYMSFGMPSGSMAVMLKLDHSGKLKLLRLGSNMSGWLELDAQPAHECNKYGYCGPFGYCDNTEPVPTCKCLDSFEPSNKIDWVNGKFSQGCLRKEALKCGHGDSFLTLPNMKMPDKFLYVRNRSYYECAAECISTCSICLCEYEQQGYQWG